jgi:hypothetical protein
MTSQRFRGRRQFADIRERKIQDEEQCRCHQHAHCRDHRVVHGGFLDAVNDRAAKDQPRWSARSLPTTTKEPSALEFRPGSGHSQ